MLNHLSRCVNAKGDDSGEFVKFAKYYGSLQLGGWVGIMLFSSNLFIA